jgi:hypothetical protein
LNIYIKEDISNIILIENEFENVEDIEELADIKIIMTSKTDINIKEKKIV